MKRRRGILALATLATISPAWGQVTERVSVGTGGIEGDGYCNGIIARTLTDDGRLVVFRSGSDNLVAGDTNLRTDIFLRDRLYGTTERLSVDGAGVQGNGHSGSYGMAITPDGRFVAFESASSNLVPGDTNGMPDVFLRDRANHTIERVALGPAGVQANGPCYYPSVTSDGRFVCFTSSATNLVPADSNGTWDVFVRDRWSNSTELLSHTAAGGQGNGSSYKAEISGDGRFVAFESEASNLVPNDTNQSWDVFLRDRLAATTTLVSAAQSGLPGNGLSYTASISADGRFVAFFSTATNLVPGDANGWGDTFLRDCLTGTTELISVSTLGVQANLGTGPTGVSADGRYVVFSGFADNLVQGDTNGRADVFVCDRRADTTTRVSLSTIGAEGNASTDGGAISSDGRYVVLISEANNLVTGDTNGWPDIFVHDGRASGFVSMCDPGSNNVIACPCANAPSEPGRGCDNSSFSGGASISALGIAYLSIDDLVFSTSGEPPSATSIVLQGSASIPLGMVFGQGVRCVGGLLKRMYVKTAVGGSITAPEVGDPAVSARAQALGDPIHAGESRYYLVYYRDPVVLGGCAATSTFNSTQTGAVSWWP